VTSLQAILAFTAAAALLTITPGLDTALVLRTAAVEGPRRAILAGLGICLGCLAWGLAASVGLGALLVLSRVAFDVVRMLGAAYLFYLGFQLLVRKRAPAAQDAKPAVSPRGWFLRGFLTNLLNPKVGVFYLTFLPQFVPAGVLVTPFSMLLASIHAAEGLLWFGFLIALTRPLSAWLSRPSVVTTLDRATGLLLIGFGVRLVLSRSR
jgi:threonine/homoserine/homoserine lactone efflux protein